MDATKRRMVVPALKFIFPAVVITAIVLVGTYWFQKKQQFPYAAAVSGVQITLKDPAMVGEPRATFTIAAGDIDGEAVLTKDLMASQAQSFVDSEIVGVTSTFKSSIAPYPGYITTLMDCDTQKYLKEENFVFEGEATKLIFAVASDRRVYGTCSMGDVKYASVFWVAYDKRRRQAVSVKLFKPISNPAEVENTQQEILPIFKKIMHEAGGV